MLNISKTSLINCSRVNLIFPPVIVDGHQLISPTNYIKNLGFIFDSRPRLSCIDQTSSVDLLFLIYTK